MTLKQYTKKEAEDLIGSSTLLNKGNHKTRKGEDRGYITFGLHFAHHKTSGHNVCSCASDGCSNSCLDISGHGTKHIVQAARIRKTRLFFANRPAFIEKLKSEIDNGIAYARNQEMRAAFRLNLTSDVMWEKYIRFADYNAPFYDYTKIYRRALDYWSGPPANMENYHLTFSRSETRANQRQCEELLDIGGNVAVVFRDHLPDEYDGYTVINGDKDDLRFLDPHPCVVGLVEKGLAKKDNTGFVVEPQ